MRKPRCACIFSPNRATQEEYKDNAKHGGHKLDCGMAATVLNLRGGAGVERGSEEWVKLRDFLNDDENFRIKVGM